MFLFKLNLCSWLHYVTLITRGLFASGKLGSSSTNRTPDGRVGDKGKAHRHCDFQFSMAQGDSVPTFIQSLPGGDMAVLIGDPGSGCMVEVDYGVTRHLCSLVCTGASQGHPRGILGASQGHRSLRIDAISASQNPGHGHRSKDGSRTKLLRCVTCCVATGSCW